MKIDKISNEYIVFNNGFEMNSYHKQDCCESIYADFSVLKTYNLSTITGKEINIFDIEFNEDIENYIKKIEDMGFILISKIGERFFVPCYNSQNGYYSRNLDLVIVRNDESEISINISDCVKDIIY